MRVRKFKKLEKFPVHVVSRKILNRKRVYLEAMVFLFGYTVISNLVFWSLIGTGKVLLTIVVLSVTGSISGAFFLFLFGHEHLFGFMKEVSSREEKVGKKWVKKFKHTGKLSTSILAGTVGGPLLGAIVVRLLLASAWYRYFLMLVMSIPSATFTVLIVRGGMAIVGV